MIKKFRKRSRREILKENLEALSSPNYLKRIAQARKSKKFYSATQIEKELGIKQ